MNEIEAGVTCTQTSLRKAKEQDLQLAALFTAGKMNPCGRHTSLL